MIPIIGSANFFFEVPADSKNCFRHLLTRQETPTQLISDNTDLKRLVRLIQAGERRFQEKLDEFKIMRPDRNTSRVHAYDEIYGQALLLNLSSLPFPGEIVWKSEITFGSHWWDDLVDREDGIAYNRLELFVANPGILDADEKEFALLWRLIGESPDPPNSLSAFMRLTYGGLIQRAPTKEKEEHYLKEYRNFSLYGIDPEVRSVIESFSPVLFWMTTKTLFELMLQPDLGDRRTLAVLLDCLFGPVIYYHDALEEADQGELKFSVDQMPKPEEQAKLIGAVGELLFKHELATAPLRIHQLKYTMAYVGPRLPVAVARAYEKFLKNWEHIQWTMPPPPSSSPTASLMLVNKIELINTLRSFVRSASP